MDLLTEFMKLVVRLCVGIGWLLGAGLHYHQPECEHTESIISPFARSSSHFLNFKLPVE
jgi:hypothetical protein